MNNRNKSLLQNFKNQKFLRSLFLSASAVLAPALTAQAQIYVTDQGGAIDDYTASGSLVATFGTDGKILVGGQPEGTVVAGGDLFVVDNTSGVISQYNASTGASINSNFVVSGQNGAVLSSSYGLAVSGNDLFVANLGNSTIGEYNLSTGATVNSSFITTNIDEPAGLLVANGNLYVANYGTGAITAYNATTGLQVPTFSATTPDGSLFGLATDGTTLYATNQGSNVNEFNLLTGTSTSSIGTSGRFTTGLAISGNNLFVDVGNKIDTIDLSNDSILGSFAVSTLNTTLGTSFVTYAASVPEPSTWAMFVVGGLGFLALRFCNSRRIS